MNSSTSAKPDQAPVQAVILAAGKGTRLQPVSQVRSKAMAPVAGKPMVARVMETLLANGVRDLILVTSPDDADLHAYFARPPYAGVQVRLVEQRERLGMGHALSLAAPFLTGDFLLTACDNLTPVAHIGELMATHRARGANGTLSLMRIDPRHTQQTGIVDWADGLIRRIVEKPHPSQAPSDISSLPLYLFSPSLLDHLPHIPLSNRGEYELQDAIQRLIDQDGKVTGVLTPTRRQITTVADLLALNRSYLDEEQPELPQGSAPFHCTPPVWLAPDVTVAPDACVGPYVTAEEGVRIGPGATVCNSILMRNAVAPPGAEIRDQVLVSV